MSSPSLELAGPTLRSGQYARGAGELVRFEDSETRPKADSFFEVMPS
jgi:hypothetical protein